MIYSKRSKKKGERRAFVLTAVALQDHFTKANRLDLSLGQAPCTVSKKAGKTAASDRGLGSVLCAGCGSCPGRSKTHKLAPLHTKRGNSCIVDCWLKETASNTHKSTQKRSDFNFEKEEQECILDPKPPPPTLAERLGLVHPRLIPLDEHGWGNVKEKSSLRGDSVQPCPICRDHFGVKQQVILSCSHVFHRACLHSFEKHSGKKCCPLCRQEKYQTRLIFEGAKECRTRAATRIQAYWRGYVVRSWYKKLRSSRPPNDPALRRKHYHNKLSNITERMLRMSVATENIIDGLFASVDRNLQDSRSVMKRYDSSGLSTITTPYKWEEIRMKAQELQVGLCAICLGELPWKQNMAASCDAAQLPLSLLSCSHVYHLNCIESLEQYSLIEHKSCPVCRSVYSRIQL